MSKADEPAFPGLEEFEKFDDEQGRYVKYTLPAGGLTKREYFAAMAMQGLLSAIYSSKEMLNEFTTDGRKHETGCDAVSRNAVSYADALLAELEEKRE